jgi:hypothetical protein
MDALQGFPDFDTKLITEKGDAICQKQDIFKGLMWFAYTNNFANWHVLKIEQVKEIVAENKLKNKVSSLEDYALEIVSEPEKDFNNAMGQESLTRFDQPKKKKRPNKNKRPAVKNGVAPGNNANRPASERKPQENKNRPAENKNRPAENKIVPNPNKIIPVNKNEPKK